MDERHAKAVSDERTLSNIILCSERINVETRRAFNALPDVDKALRIMAVIASIAASAARRIEANEPLLETEAPRMHGEADFSGVDPAVANANYQKALEQLQADLETDMAVIFDKPVSIEVYGHRGMLDE